MEFIRDYIVNEITYKLYSEDLLEEDNKKTIHCIYDGEHYHHLPHSPYFDPSDEYIINFIKTRM